MSNKLAWKTRNNKIWAYGQRLKAADVYALIAEAKRLGVYDEYANMPLCRIHHVHPRSLYNRRNLLNGGE